MHGLPQRAAVARRTAQTVSSSPRRSAQRGQQAPGHACVARSCPYPALRVRKRRSPTRTYTGKGPGSGRSTQWAVDSPVPPVMMSSPIRMLPPAGLRKPEIMRRMVVLPQPEGPRIEKNSPAFDHEVGRIYGSKTAEFCGYLFEDYFLAVHCSDSTWVSAPPRTGVIRFVEPCMKRQGRP